MKGIRVEDEFKVSVIADTSAFETALSGLEKQAKGFGNTLSGALKSAIIDGESLSEVLRHRSASQPKAKLAVLLLWSISQRRTWRPFNALKLSSARQSRVQ